MANRLTGPKDWREWLDALETPSKPLTDWETQFIESVSDQLTNRGMLSGKQVEILERIYAEKTD